MDYCLKRQVARALYVSAWILFVIGLFTNSIWWGFAIILVVSGFYIYINAEYKE